LSTAGKGGASYGWWAAFLHDFALPMASERLHRSRPATGMTAPPLPAEEPVS
jgi:hypothetical protein